MDFDFSNTRTWTIPHNGSQCEVLKVVDSEGTTIWKKYYRVQYDLNAAGLQYWTVWFNTNGGTGTMAAMHVPKGTSGTLPACTFTRAGYTLKAQQYNTSPNGTGTSYAAGGSITPTSNMTLYAQWQAASHTISFNNGAADASGSMNQIGTFYGQTVTLPACMFTRSGYLFDTWKCFIDESTQYFNDEDIFTMPNQDITLTAQWQEHILLDEYEWVVVDEGNGASKDTAAGNPATAYTFYGTINSLGVPEGWSGNSARANDYYAGLMTDRCNCYVQHSTYECYYWVKLARLQKYSDGSLDVAHPDYYLVQKHNTVSDADLSSIVGSIKGLLLHAEDGHFSNPVLGQAVGVGFDGKFTILPGEEISVSLSSSVYGHTSLADGAIIKPVDLCPEQDHLERYGTIIYNGQQIYYINVYPDYKVYYKTGTVYQHNDRESQGSVIVYTWRTVVSPEEYMQDSSRYQYMYSGKYNHVLHKLNNDGTTTPMSFIYNTGSHTVTFKDWNGTTLKTQSVVHGMAATAPANPSRTGYNFTGWDKSFSCVINDMTVNAQYTEDPVTITFNSNN